MDMYVGGRWRPGSSIAEVRNPYSGAVVGTTPLASESDALLALETAERGAVDMAALPSYTRAEILEAAADRVESRRSELAEVICLEQGKTRREADAEAARIAPMLRYCAAEAVRRSGEVLAMDAASAGVGRLGFTLPEPCGVIVAITPFNYPALLVCHKVGPALAAGNAVILKPAEATPLTALLLTRCLIESGLPARGLQCITGSGSLLGPVLCSSSLVRKISFTGSVGVGNAIARSAGAKRLSCELGSHAAVVVLDDADVGMAAREIVRSGYVNAGQVCISAQRVLVTPGSRDELLEGVTEAIDGLIPGDPRLEETTMGPVINDAAAARIVGVIDSARRNGGEVLRGGDAEGALVAPSLILDPPRTEALWADELFGPAVAVRTCANVAEAIEVANDSRFGLSMSVFTLDIDRALKFAREVQSGMVHINSGPLFRIDSMPYGGVRDSGFGKEGIRYAVDEMTEHKLVVVHPGSGG
jgi:acyl-CoA reductase-like NAD-dependent aldehyde dehydrogenase